MSGSAVGIAGAAVSDVKVGTEGKYPPPMDPCLFAFSDDSTGDISGLTSVTDVVTAGGGGKGVPCGTELGREGCVLSGALSTVGGR